MKKTNIKRKINGALYFASGDSALYLYAKSLKRLALKPSFFAPLYNYFISISFWRARVSAVYSHLAASFLKA